MTPKLCKHGELEDVCQRCEIAQLTAELEAAKAEIIEWRRVAQNRKYRNAALRAALEAVEWVTGYSHDEGGIIVGCPWCDARYHEDKATHKPDCPRQAALEGGEVE